MRVENDNIGELTNAKHLSPSCLLGHIEPHPTQLSASKMIDELIRPNQKILSTGYVVVK